MNNLLNMEFMKEHMMGPNAVKMLEELCRSIDLTGAERILDLGCGKGLTSIYLAKRFQAEVFAMDLWISATENYERFCTIGLDRTIIPIHADANQPPLAEQYFDAVISIDAYHYFGLNEHFMDTSLAPLVKKGGLIALAFPGVKQELGDSPPSEFSLSWSAEDLSTFHSCPWWQALLSNSHMFELLSIAEMNCFEECWQDWLSCDNPYAVADRPAMEAGAGKYMNLIKVIGRRRTD